MDHKEFDALVTRIANASSRRDAVKGIVGGALGAAGLGALAADEAEGKGKGKGKGKGNAKGRGGQHHADRNGQHNASAEKHKHHHKKKKKKCKLQPGQTRCSKKVCVDLQTNVANCGSCGHACVTGQICKAGVCKSGT